MLFKKLNQGLNLGILIALTIGVLCPTETQERRGKRGGLEEEKGSGCGGKWVRNNAKAIPDQPPLPSPPRALPSPFTRLTNMAQVSHPEAISAKLRFSHQHLRGNSSALITCHRTPIHLHPGYPSPAPSPIYASMLPMPYFKS